MTDTNKKRKSADRILLSAAESEKLRVWLESLQESTKGLLRLTKADLVAFLIRSHPAELNKKEIQQIRQDHYDPVRHLLWITPKLREALQSGDADTVQSLQGEIKAIELMNVAIPLEENKIQKPRKQRTKRPTNGIENSPEPLPVDPLEEL